MAFKNERSPSAPVIYGNISLDPKDGSITGTTGNFETLNVGGNALGDTLAELDLSPRGTQLLYRLRGNMTNYVSQTSQSLLKLNLTLEDMRDHILITPPIRIDTMNAMTNVESGYAAMSIKVTSTNNSVANWQQDIFCLPFTASRKVLQFPPSTISMLRTHGGGDAKILLYIWISFRAQVVPWRINQDKGLSEFVLADMGSTLGRDYLTLDLGTIADTGTTPVPEPQPEPTPTKYTGDFYASHYATYSLNSEVNQTSDYPGMILQSTTITPRIGMTAFNGRDQHGRSLADLRASNVTITGIGIYIGAAYGGVNTKWYYSAGGIGRLYWHGNKAGFPSTGIPSRTFIQDIPDWKNNQEKAVNVFSAVKSAITNGTFGGFALSGEGKTRQNTYHGEFPYRMRLRINYTITE